MLSSQIRGGCRRQALLRHRSSLRFAHMNHRSSTLFNERHRQRWQSSASCHSSPTTSSCICLHSTCTGSSASLRVSHVGTTTQSRTLSTSTTTTKKKVAKKKATRKKTTTAKAVPIAEELDQPQGFHEKSIEEQYSKKSPLEHVLLRPGMYIGPVERLPPTPCWVLDPPIPPPSDGSATMEQARHAMEAFMRQQQSDDSIHDNENVNADSIVPTFRMKQQEYALVPGLVKIFDEILVNASDNRLRHPDSCTRIDVVIHPGSSSATDEQHPFIIVRNDGKGIPVEIHKEEQMYVPEMLFGHLLTGSNFDDDERRITGGRHGYGAKLTNIFSKQFTVETVDTQRQLRYQQTWKDNMTQASSAQIDSLQNDEAGNTVDYTCLTYVPDMERFDGNIPDADTAAGDSSSNNIHPNEYAIMCKRVLDAAGCAAGQLKVTLNGVDVTQDSFASYIQLYRRSDDLPFCFADINDRWTIGVGLSESKSLQTISFVNGMATPRGGTHVDMLVQQLVQVIKGHVAKMEPILAGSLQPNTIKRNLFVACNALIENATFDSQMKECLTSTPKSFGSQCKLSPEFLERLVQPQDEGGSGIVEAVIRAARDKQQESLIQQVGGKKSKSKLMNMPKLEDAHEAGGKDGHECTLILTEGDSAKALAVSGLEKVGRDLYGVFPLRGKFLNVRDVSVQKLVKNEEVKALVAILGLNFKLGYATAAERQKLRYGHVMLMTDQDNDGSHIKGLVINFFRHFWPNLLKPPDDEPEQRPFLASFITPLLKVAPKGKKGGKIKSFYSAAEYTEWRDSLVSSGGDIKRWKIKYYKGLGTSTATEAKAYFAEFERHYRPFVWHSEMDGEMLDKVFEKFRSADRRDWLINEYDSMATVVADVDNSNAITYEDFVNKEMIHFSHADNVRSLPNVIDGLKPSQRKVLHACFKRKLKSEIKVAQLTGYVAEHTAYHHGEASLQSTIIGMAQDFVGSNNINLLEPNGQFGTRLMGGDDAASPRYIFTRLNPITRHIYPEADDVLLEYLEEDGQIIEPRYYCPIIPMLLVNGSQGIGTGWSTYIPPHNPMQVLDYVRAKLEDRSELPIIEPFARGFEGAIEKKGDGTGYVSTGRIRRTTKKTVLIDELPIGVWTNRYKERLIKMKEDGLIEGFVEDHTTTKVSFKVSMKGSKLDRLESKNTLEKVFKLKSAFSTSNMHAFDPTSTIQLFSSAQDIADAYFPIRLSLYHDRKSVIVSEMEFSAALSKNKSRFIEAVTDGTIDLLRGGSTKAETVAALRSLSFTSMQELDRIRNNNSLSQRRATLQDESGTPHEDEDFEYLLRMPLASLNVERIDALTADMGKTERELEATRSQTPEEAWMADLDKLAAHL